MVNKTKKDKRLTIKAIQEQIQAGTLSCMEVVQAYLKNIKKYQHLNAFLEVFEEEVLHQAKNLDEKIKSGIKTGRLAGTVIAIKDVICYKNHKVSAASEMLKDFEAIYTATALQRLLDEDAIIIGRLNCDEFAMGSTNENSAFGPVKNGYDENRVAGGSSGGSAVAVQMNMCTAALGSDTGGSVRQPAAFCGVIGLKPGYGRISRHGLIAYASSFDQIGLFTNRVEDAASLLEIMSGADIMDATCSDVEVPEYLSEINPVEKQKIAYYKNALEDPALDEDIRQQTAGYLSRLQAKGHEVSAIEHPYWDYLVPVYYILTTAEATSNLSRYTGVHYGHSHKGTQKLNEIYKNNRTEGFGEEVKRRIMLGNFVLSSGFYDAYYTKAQKVRRLIKKSTLRVFNEYDFIVMPASPSIAYQLGEQQKSNPLAIYLADIYTVQASLAGIPAISLPLFKHQDGNMPFGLQIMSASFEEDKLLRFAHYLMNETLN